jgi:hypothetical protein
MNPLVRRQRALQATIDKYGSRPFDWGAVDCGRVIAFHLKQLGHKIRLSKAGQYKTALGARAALKRLGYDSLPDAMDGHGLPRVPAAMALLGDIVLVPGDDELGALGIYAGNGKYIGFHEDHERMVSMIFTSVDVAWKAI